MVGTFTAPRNINSRDALVLEEDGRYTRTLHRSDGTFVYRRTAQWSYEDGRILLKDFLVDDDEVYPPGREQIDLSLFEMDCSFPVRMGDGSPTFYDREELGVGQYVKL